MANVTAPTIVCEKNKVTITATEEGAVIYYTIDGNEPTQNETNKYTAAFDITADCTVKAIAVVGSDASTVASKEVTFEKSSVVEEAPAKKVCDHLSDACDLFYDEDAFSVPAEAMRADFDYSVDNTCDPTTTQNELIGTPNE